MILNWSRATVLAAPAFEACWDVLGLGETPWQLEPPRHGLTAATRQAFVAEVTAQLRAARPEIPAWLRLLAHPAWSVDVRLRADDLVAGLVAGRGALAVLAVRHADGRVGQPRAADIDGRKPSALDQAGGRSVEGSRHRHAAFAKGAPQ